MKAKVIIEEKRKKTLELGQLYCGIPPHNDSNVYMKVSVIAAKEIIDIISKSPQLNMVLDIKSGLFYTHNPDIDVTILEPENGELKLVPIK